MASLRRIVPSAPLAVSISGNVSTSGGAGISGADITVTGGFGGSAVRDIYGNYTVSGLANGYTYTVTPSKSGYTFDPTNRTYFNVNSNVTGANFTGTPPSYTISGRVTNGSGAGISGATITLAGTESRTATTDSNGNYSFTGLTANGNYTVTASKSGYSFTPQNRDYLNLSSNVANADFTGTALPPPPTTFNKTINYAYNSVGALGSVGTDLIGADPNNTTNVLNTVTFRASGALSGLNYGNGRRLAMGYNANRQQPVSMKVDRASNPSDKIIDYAYQYYDANGKNNNRIRQITDNVDPAYTTSYLYDDYNRLTNATASAYTKFYSHDNWGNITDFSGVAHNFATNGSGAPATNRIISDGWGNNYSYDPAGNMTQAGSASYSYDGAGRLKEVGTGGQNVYRYDGDGMRVKKVESGSAVYYVRSSALKNVAMEVKSTGVYRAYVYSGGKLVAQQSTDGQFYWLHTNHLGSSRAMTDVNGTLVYKGQFDPYGQVLMEWGSASLNTKKFTGYERDGATGLDYAGARMYNSGRGRFMQPDPAGLKAANLGHPLSLNRYAYVYNDPANLIDPGGMFAGMFGCFLLGFGGGDGWSYDEYRCFASMWIPGIPTGAFDFNIPVVGSQDPYNGLTQDEKILCILHPEVCSRVAWARADALQERQRRYGDTGDNDDWCDNAFLHAYWNARMVQLISALPSDPFYIGSTAVEMAKAFADAHEARPNNPVEEQQMDFWNNNVGRIIATQNPNATPEQLAELIQNEVNAGRVLVMDGNGIAPRHPRPGECDPND